MSALILGLLLAFCLPLLPPAASQSSSSAVSVAGGRGRALLGFTETRGNASFQCSPSGPCLPCLYSEKSDDKYRCSETGYRVPLKCVEVRKSSEGKTDDEKQRKLYSNEDAVEAVGNLKGRRLADDSSTTSEKGAQEYVTFRSCVPVDGEEKLSFLGFEMIMFGLLLISGPVAYMRQRRTAPLPGAARIPTSAPRF